MTKIGNETQFNAAQAATTEAVAAPRSEKEKGTLEIAGQVASTAQDVFGGTFIEDYMKVATAVEAKVTKDQEARAANGQTVNKATEIMSRLKHTPEMLGFMLKRVFVPVGTLIASL